MINLCLWRLGGSDLVWAVLLQETFERAKAWVKELQRQASPNIVIALAGNKADLAERRLVEFEVTLWALRYLAGVAETILPRCSREHTAV